MKYGTITGIGQPVSRVVLGSVAMFPHSQELSNQLLDTFLARGGTMVDSAHVYNGGGAERSIGAWLAQRGKRDDVLILTKGAHHNALGKRVTPSEIAFDIGQSLERLRANYVDLYVLHRDDPEVPVGPIVEALNDHQRRGRIKAFGGSNWTHERLQEALDYATAHSLAPFAASSPNLSLAVPKEPMWADCVSVSGDAAALAWYRQRQFPLFSWSSQAGGFFTGRFSPDRPDNMDMVRVYYSDGNWERYRRAEQFGKELGGYTPIQIALAWVLNQPDLNVFPLIGPHKVEELNSSLDAAELTLAPDQVKWLNLED